MPKSNVDPLIIYPTSTHTHTFIVLHGRGSNALRFSQDTTNPIKPGFLTCTTSSGLTLAQKFPGLKFVVPTAPKRRCTAKKRLAMNIWFDNSSFEDPYEREELQCQGLADNYEMVKEIVTEEAKELGERGLQKVFLGGLSQGCAMSLHVLLAFDRDEEEKCMGFGGFIGMSGWLPFQDEINSLLGIRRGDDGEEDENPFGDESGDEEDGGDAEDPVVKVTRFIRKDVMNLSKAQNELLVCRHTPIFLGHGDQDDVVPLEYGKNVMEALQAMGMNLEWKVYAEQGHWYKVPDTIDDIVRFLEKNMQARTLTRYSQSIYMKTSRTCLMTACSI
jgi:predicted esterase